MNLSLIPEALAAAGPAPQEANIWVQIVPLLLIFAIFYFLLIRPQMKKAKDLRNLIASLAKGDEVVTQGGLVGRVVQVGDDYLQLEVGELEGAKAGESKPVVVKVQKTAVTLLLPKGTLKKL